MTRNEHAVINTLRNPVSTDVQCMHYRDTAALRKYSALVCYRADHNGAKCTIRLLSARYPTVYRGENLYQFNSPTSNVASSRHASANGYVVQFAAWRKSFRSRYHSTPVSSPYFIRNILSSNGFHNSRRVEDTVIRFFVMRINNENLLD